MRALEYKGQKVITTELLAMVYETNPSYIRNNFNRSKSKFELGKHYYCLQGDDLKHFKGSHLSDDTLKFTSILYLWTERGANRHCKILDTDKAWEQFDNLEETYFKVKQEALNAICEVKYLNGIANFLRIQRTIMREQGATPKEIAQMAQSTCISYGVPLPINYIHVDPYEQMMLPSFERVQICNTKNNDN